MSILLAMFAFILVMIAAITLGRRISLRNWKKLEFPIIALGFLGVVIALAQSSAQSRQAEASRLSARANDSLMAVISATEWAMGYCGVWWDEVKNQTNDPPVACLAPHPRVSGETCEAVCRAGHLVGQHRYAPVEPENQSDKAEYFLGVCYSDIEDQLWGVCSAIDSYQAAAQRVDLALEGGSVDRLLASNWLALAAQFLIAIALGLQVGKVTAELRADPR